MNEPKSQEAQILMKQSRELAHVAGLMRDKSKGDLLVMAMEGLMVGVATVLAANASILEKINDLGRTVGPAGPEDGSTADSDDGSPPA